MKILIAAGGTGGHIYPALAIADAFRVARPGVEIEFVGTAAGLENKIIPPKGYKVNHLPIGRLNSNVALSERIKTVLRMPLALVKSVSILRAVKPDFVLGVGGHASGPLLLMASLLGYRSAIWEPNAMPGMANRLLARFVDDCWVVFAEAKALLKSSHLHSAGMPVRAEIESRATPASASEANGGTFNILVFGGSQGARGISTAVFEMVRDNPSWMKRIKIVHQTGAYDFTRMKEAYTSIGSPLAVDVREYLHDMPEQYGAAELVICRSGTGTLFELAACGKPSILVPLPTAADDHQRKNAESLVAKGAAVMLLQKDLNGKTLFAAIESLRQNPQRLAEMSKAIGEFHHRNAAATLVGEFVERIEHASR